MAKAKFGELSDNQRISLINTAKATIHCLPGTPCLLVR